MGTRKNRKQKKGHRTTADYIRKKSNVPACSPYAKKHQIASDTCFTKDTLFELKTIYNEHNPGNPILSSKPTEIWREIKRDRIKQCEKDSCWISHIVKNEQAVKKLHSLLFPPVPPHEWKKNPTTWLTNYDILHVLKQYQDTYPEFRFMGPCPIDFATILDDGKCVNPEMCQFSLSNKKHTKIGVVFNLDRHDQSGSHWVSLFIDLVDNFIFYFDSTGEKAPPEIESFIKKVTSQKPLEVYNSTKIEHQLKDTECGMYSLYFIITMLLREREDGSIMSKEEVISLFKGKFGLIKDDRVQELREFYFSEGGKKNKTVRFR
jgi:hypothetical protein